MALIKKSDAASALAPLWHPNFRNFEKLPDTKVVRTTFFINVTAITLAASLVILVGYRQYRIRDLNLQIQETQNVIQKNTKENTEAIKLSKSFDDEAKKLTEAGMFARKFLQPSELILLLGKTLPKEVQIESADMRFSGASGDQCILRGVVAGNKDDASGLASNYEKILRTSPVFAAKFESVNTASLNPDPTGGFLRFEIVIKFKSPGAEKKS